MKGFTLEDAVVTTPDATGPGESSIAVWVSMSSEITFRRVSIAAGRGGNGSAGIDGNEGCRWSHGHERAAGAQRLVFPPSSPEPSRAVTGDRAASDSRIAGGQAERPYCRDPEIRVTTGIPGNENSGAADGGPGSHRCRRFSWYARDVRRPERHFFGYWRFAFGTWREWRRGKSGPRWRRRKGKFGDSDGLYRCERWGGRHGRVRRSDGNGGRKRGRPLISLSWQSVISRRLRDHNEPRRCGRAKGAKAARAAWARWFAWRYGIPRRWDSYRRLGRQGGQRRQTAAPALAAMVVPLWASCSREPRRRSSTRP